MSTARSKHYDIYKDSLIRDQCKCTHNLESKTLYSSIESIDHLYIGLSIYRGGLTSAFTSAFSPYRVTLHSELELQHAVQK